VGNNPFHLRLEPDKQERRGIASAFLMFTPECPKCGADLDSNACLIKPTKKGKVPNFWCINCNLCTNYRFEHMLKAVDDFHLRYTTSKLHEMGYFKINWNRDALNYKSEDRDYIQ
jgi:transcription elongation factor Elf1